MLRFVVLVFALLALAPAPARAADDLVAPYAAALRAFNHRLTPDLATALARRTLREADTYGLDARLFTALVAVESSWHPAARSPVGALGLGQLMPATAAALAVDPADPEANLAGAARYLATLLARYRDRPERVTLALAAYNAGGGAVERYGGVPPYAETRTYVRRVIGLWRRLCGTDAVLRD